MAGGKGVKKKQTVKNAKKTAPAAAKSKKAVKAPRKMSTAAGQRKKMVKTGKNASKGGTGKKTLKTPGKNANAVCKAPKTPKPKTAKSPGKKILGEKLTAVTNLGAGPSSKPIKNKPSKVQASGAIPGTSQNTGQTSTKKRAPKRKLDQPKQATQSIKKIRINLPKQEMSCSDQRPIHINMVQPVQPVQTYPTPTFNKLTVQEHYNNHPVMSVPVYEPNNHFVDKYREALINRVSLVDPILDSLLAENVLNLEQYDNIRSKPTSQEQMRELYKHITVIGDTAKNKFYYALEKNCALLIKDLKGT